MAARRERGWRDPAKEQFWRRMLRQWKRSGLTIRDFCDFESLSEPSFYSWRRELAKRDQAGAEAERVSKPRSLRFERQEPGATFLPVHVVANERGVPGESTSGGNAHIEVHLPSGVRVRVPAGCNRQSLIEVLAALESRPC